MTSDRVAGGSVVERVRARIGDDSRIRLLGFLPTEALPDFYASIDAFAFPSVNSLEAFGLVQVEAMMVGVPVLASVICPECGCRCATPGSARSSRSGTRRPSPPRWPASSGPSSTGPALAAQARERYGAASVIERYRVLFAEVARSAGTASG